MLGETDPVYQMEVTLSATLHPGVAALEVSVFCYNPRDARMPQMFWINTAVPATPRTRFLYQMSRTVGHTTADIADWPVHNGIDYSWDRNNQHMLGLFGIDAYDDFNGAYQFDNDYGVFRYADRRLVQGMKLWTFGYGPGAKDHERSYTDKAGPYVELPERPPCVGRALRMGGPAQNGGLERVVGAGGRDSRRHQPGQGRRAEPRGGQRDRQNHAGRDPPNPAREAADKRILRRDRTG